MTVVVSVERPVAPEVVALLEQHLAFAREVTPEGGVFALDLEALSQPAVTFFCAREDGRLLGIAALQELEAGHGELKSMHVAAALRGQGVDHRSARCTVEP